LSQRAVNNHSSTLARDKFVIGAKSVSLIGAMNDRGARSFARLVIVLAGVTAYANSVDVPFAYDDEASIVQNPSIRTLWPLSTPLSPPGHGIAVQNRPLANFSFALNYAFAGSDGLKVEGYHYVNIAIHIANGLLIFSLICRTLALHAASTDDLANTLFAGAVALLWVVHPINSEAVTYVVQRTESLASLFYLLTLYGLVRSAASPRPGRWQAVTVFACACGMATKEIVVSAPIMALLYDRLFLSGSWRACFAARKGLYVGLAATCLIPLLLQISGDRRGTTAGWGLGVTAFDYLKLQAVRVVEYLRLCFWPRPLTIDYGTTPLGPAPFPPLQFAVLTALLSASAIAIYRRPKLGYLGVFFFVVLAPTSSFLPIISEVAAERRMYLPSAVVVILVVAGCREAIRYACSRFPRCGGRDWLITVAAAGTLGVAATLTLLTIERNRQYRTPLDLWTDAALNVPANPRASYNLANELLKAGRTREAAEQYRRVLQTAPRYARAKANLGNALIDLGQVAEGVRELREALEIDAADDRGVFRPGELAAERATTHYNLGNGLLKLGDVSGAVAQYEQSLMLAPDFSPALSNLGILAFQDGRYDEAVAYFRRRVATLPNDAESRGQLALALSRTGQSREARSKYEQALRLDPRQINTLGNYAWFLSTCPDAEFRDGPKARQLAESGIRLTNAKHVTLLRSMAAALAETGSFIDASRTAQRLMQMAAAQGDTALADAVSADFRLYSAGKPYRDPLLQPRPKSTAAP
jgi:tetratricopeptide (TPR) repeat protein